MEGLVNLKTFPCHQPHRRSSSSSLKKPRRSSCPRSSNIREEMRPPRSQHRMGREQPPEPSPLLEMERELQVEVQEKKRLYHKRERQRQINSLLDTQVTTL